MRAVAVFLLTATLAVGADTPIPKTEPAVLTAPSSGTIVVGQIVLIKVEGLVSPEKAIAHVMPTTARVLPVFVANSAPGYGWSTWGQAAKLLFQADQPGTYDVTLVTVDGDSPVPNSITLEVTGPRPPPVMVVTPASSFTAAGKVGGPFEPRLIHYDVKASEEGWACKVDQPWLAMLKGGTGVDVLIGPGAENLEAGTHQGKITFTLGTLAEVRDVTLVVGDVPNPNPNPNPPESLWGIVVEETQDRTAEQAVVLASPKVRALFGDGQFQVVDRDGRDQAGNVPSWAGPYIERTKKMTLPVLFITDEQGNILVDGKPLPGTVAEMQKLVDSILKGGIAQ